MNLGLREAGQVWPRPRRGLASEAKRTGTETKRSSRGLETVQYLLESQQSSTPNEFPEFRPQLAKGRPQGKFESFKAMDYGKTKMS